MRVVGEERGRRHRDEGPVAHAEQVLGVKRGIIGAATRSDDEAMRRDLADSLSNRHRRVCTLRQQPRGHLRLFGDLRPEVAHRRGQLRMLSALQEALVGQVRPGSR